MRALPTETHGGKLGKMIRGKVGETTDSILMVFYLLLFMFFIMNKRASLFLMLFTRVARSFDYLVYQQTEYGQR